MNKTELMLQEVQKRNGLTFVECQRFLVELKYGPGSYNWRVHRGMYCGSVLCGLKNYDGRKRPSNMGPGSVLDKWCDKGVDRKYRIKAGAVLQSPYFPKKWVK